jgi:5-methylcytosine-specific restriction enzyme A
MPMMPRKPCPHPGCPRLTTGGYCEEHAKERQRQYDRERYHDEARQWYFSPRWRRASKAYLDEHPLCEPCLKLGIEHAAQVVDHKMPHKGNYDLFWDESNWQSMAKRCHDLKTAKEDGRWTSKKL